MASAMGNGWEKWSNHVLKELERLSSELKELGNFVDTVKTHSTENTEVSKAICDRIVNLSKRLDDLAIDLKDLNIGLTNLKVSVAGRLAYGGLGGGIVTLLIKVLEYIIKNPR